MAIREVYSSYNSFFFLLWWVVGGGGAVISKVPSLSSRLFTLQDSGETVKALLNPKCFCPNDSNHAEISDVLAELERLS